MPVHELFHSIKQFLPQTYVPFETPSKSPRHGGSWAVTTLSTRTCIQTRVPGGYNGKKRVRVRSMGVRCSAFLLAGPLTIFKRSSLPCGMCLEYSNCGLPSHTHKTRTQDGNLENGLAVSCRVFFFFLVLFPPSAISLWKPPNRIQNITHTYIYTSVSHTHSANKHRHLTNSK